MRVLAVDPGPHVGFAHWSDARIPVSGPGGFTETDDFQAGEWTPAEFYSSVERCVQATDVVVCEDFRISGPRAKEANVTIEMIGVLRYLSYWNGKQFVTQPPGAYKFAGADKLKRLGWYTPSDHSRSASGHLVLYLAENNLIDRARLLPSVAGGGT